MQKMLISSKKEISRLVQNNKILFDLLPDMLLIIKDNFVIEHMNAAAVAILGDQHGLKCFQITAGLESPCETGMCPFNCQNPEQYYGQMFERKLNDRLYVEYCYVPFEGYRRDKLTLLIIRDITEKKLHALELEKYSKNIEEILKKKIAIIKANEIERKQLYQEVNYFKKEIERFVGREKMIGESKPIHALREMIYQVAPSDATILITGESGTGKELVADLVHAHSSRANNRYLKFNCAAVAESLLESDLFGYEKGSFTGATERRMGKFEEADKGTVFLDEIGDISPKMQASLLRVLQEGEILRIGSNIPIPVDVRIIAATNVDLSAVVKAGKFRRDLYYRLNVINLNIVPLRERKEDIVPLSMNFLMKYRERFNKEVTFLPNSVVAKLLEYNWPGNVRELENALQRAVLLCKDGMISPQTMEFLQEKSIQCKTDPVPFMNRFLNRPLKNSISIFEAEIISNTLRQCNNDIDNTSEQLGLSKTTFYEKIKRYGINLKQPKKNI
jgi:transcriptional regulator with PAS, ATPase and Fis domain